MTFITLISTTQYLLERFINLLSLCEVSVIFWDLQTQADQQISIICHRSAADEVQSNTTRRLTSNQYANE